MKILIIGAGQVGYFLCDRLSREGHAVTLVDQDEETIERAQDRLNVLGVCGNGASAEILEQAGIKDTDIFIAVTNMDEVNILACLLAREYKVKTRVARTKSIEYTGQKAVLSKEKLGIDLLINPEDAVAEELFKLACTSRAFDVAEFVEGQIHFQGFRITEDSPICNLTLADLGELRGIYRFVVVAIHRGKNTIIPRGEDSIQAGDRIYIFAHQDELPAINYMLHAQNKEKKGSMRAFILGGSSIGLQIAQNMERHGIISKLIEKNEERCYKLAEELSKAVVINAEGLDLQTLLDEGIEDADVFVAVTENDQTNILTCLLAKQHSVKRTLALVSQPELIDLASELGIDACVSPRMAAASTILKFVRRGEIISITAVEDSDSEVLEFEIKADSGLVGVPLSELHFPRGAIIGAIVRGNGYEIPTGESRLEDGDRVVIFALPDALQKVERFFS
ncbi:trk system potassium uptake protein TrkA [Malonomonas rubra DSM 5091]|uniref:Trk system potassium uptake protein TrkA n=1 Tax=Malonomonas rubra DSM 5091 TaxID=1122189 RepID=A0A1M6J9R9_MALRU|nr:Trk system potassium transporter TrkA [Malonomonas rubra]SHJ43458.1 trk system potassium uptake protein TrkA [Malonomonas rubra DSM 5091]